MKLFRSALMFVCAGLGIFTLTGLAGSFDLFVFLMAIPCLTFAFCIYKNTSLSNKISAILSGIFLPPTVFLVIMFSYYFFFQDDAAGYGDESSGVALLAGRFLAVFLLILIFFFIYNVWYYRRFKRSS